MPSVVHRIDQPRHTVRTVEKGTGKVINLVFCDVFEMRDALIKKLTSYLMNV